MCVEERSEDHDEVITSGRAGRIAWNMRLSKDGKRGK